MQILSLITLFAGISWVAGVRLPFVPPPVNKLDKTRAGTMNPFQKYHFWVSISVGTPPQEKVVFLDTGSYHLVFGSEPNMQQFDCSKSYTCIKRQQNVGIPWGYNGSFVSDSVHFSNSLCARNASIGIINKGSVLSGYGYYLPIMGLALGGIRRNELVEPIGQILRDKANCYVPYFSLLLKGGPTQGGSVPVCGQEVAGEMRICELDPTVKQNDIYWIPVGGDNQNETWNVKIDAIYYGNTRIEGNHGYAMIDSGQNQMAFNDKGYDQILKLMGAKDVGTNPTYECGKAKNLLPFKITLNGRNFTIPMESYVDPCSFQGPTCLLRIHRNGPIGTGLHSNFLRMKYTVFDPLNARIGVKELI